jgi:hypothetical protein
MKDNSRVQALSRRFIRKLAEDEESDGPFRFPKPWWQREQGEVPSSGPVTQVLDDPRQQRDTILAPPPEFEEEYEDTMLPPPPATPTLPSPSMEEYHSPAVDVGVEVPVGEVMGVVPEQVFSEFLAHHAPEGEGQMIVALSIGDTTVGAYSLTNIPGRRAPQIRKMDNVKPLAYSLDDFMTWLETNQPTTWWKANKVMKEYQ